MKKRDYNWIKNEVELTVSDKQEFNEEIFQNNLRNDFDDNLRLCGKVNWKTIAFLIFLLTLALIVTFIAYLKIYVYNEKVKDHIGIIILSIFLYIPSLYYLAFVLLVLCGIEGFSFNDLPETNFN